MSTSEYLAFLPMLIYGIALTDLFRQWSRFSKLKQLYLPYFLLTIILTETALYHVFLFAGLLDHLKGLTYASYLVYLVPPFLFLLTTIFFTPGKGADTEEHFVKYMPVFLSFFALYTASHFLHEFNELKSVFVIRSIGILWILMTGIFRKKWMVYILGVLWIWSLFSKVAALAT